MLKTMKAHGKKNRDRLKGFKVSWVKSSSLKWLTCRSKWRFAEASLWSKWFSVDLSGDRVASLVMEHRWSLRLCCCRSTCRRLCKAWSHQHFQSLWWELIQSSAKIQIQLQDNQNCISFLTWTVKLLSNLNLRLCIGDFSFSLSLMLEQECDLCNEFGLAFPISFRIGRGVKVDFKMFDALT